MAKNIKFSFSGVGANIYHDGTMKVDYILVQPEIPSSDQPLGELNYNNVIDTAGALHYVEVNYTNDTPLNITAQDGVVTNASGGINYSIYRREYEEFQKHVRQPDGSYRLETDTYIGSWEPVALQVESPMLRDFNITTGRSYQYVLYPITDLAQQVMSNVDETTNKSIPVKTHWECWSLAELIPIETPVDAPIVKKSYKVDINNIWLFKYSLQTGEQTQNFQKQEVQTLGQYSRFGYGQQNYISGNVSCLLGSEIVPYSKYGYIERRRESIAAPLTTNEKIEMLRQWRKIAFSPNPKLLKDMKGQSWIVQIISNSNNPQNFYHNQPDTISFAWKEIGDLDKTTIIGVGYDIPQPGQCNSIWEPVK